MGFCTLCLYLKKPNTQHWCKDYFSRNKLFCERCVVHSNICTSPSTHEKTVLPDSVAEEYDDDAEEEEPPEIDDVVRAQCVTLEEYDHNEYDYGYENNDGHDDDW